jgi:hypothetical protein
MKLRFEVNQAECLRRGIDCPKSIVTVEVNPAELSQEIRDLLAVRMRGGIDVCRRDSSIFIAPQDRLVADAPTFDALVEAVRKDEAKPNRNRGSVKAA